MKKVSSIMLIGFLFLAACQPDSRPTSNTNNQIERDTSSGASQQQQQQLKVSSNLEEAVQQWNRAINERNFELLRVFYADDVNINGSVYSADEYLRTLHRDLQGNKEFQQQVQGQVMVETRTPTVAKTTFSRQIKTTEKLYVEKTFLLFENIDNQWKIVGQGLDAELETSNKNNARYITCDEAAEAYFKEVPAVKSLLAEAHVRYLLERRPTDAKNINKRYGFWIFYAPAGAQQTETFGRYEIDAQTAKIYELDVVENKYIEITGANQQLQQNLLNACR